MADRIRQPNSSRTPVVELMSDQEMFGAQVDIANFAPVIQQDPNIANYSPPNTITYQWDVAQPLVGPAAGWAMSNNSNNPTSTKLYLSMVDINGDDVTSILKTMNFGTASIIRLIAEADATRFMEFACVGVTVVPHAVVSPDDGVRGWYQPTVVPLTNSPDIGAGDGPFNDIERVLCIITTIGAAGAGVVSTRKVCTSATHPLLPSIGDELYETDTGNTLIYQSVTTGWTPPWNTSWGDMGAPASATASQGSITTLVDLTSLTKTFTAIGHRIYRATITLLMSSSVATDQIAITLTDGSNTVKMTWFGDVFGANKVIMFQQSFDVFGLAAGSTTLKLRAQRNTGTGTISLSAGAAFPAILQISDAGANGAPL